MSRWAGEPRPSGRAPIEVSSEEQPLLTLRLRAHPGARREEVRFIPPDGLEIWLREPPRNGRANVGIVRLLSETLGVRRSAVRIVRGASGREKIVEIDDADHRALERLRHDDPG